MPRVDLLTSGARAPTCVSYNSNNINITLIGTNGAEVYIRCCVLFVGLSGSGPDTLTIVSIGFRPHVGKKCRR
jgi:hypothetical protein